MAVLLLATSLGCSRRDEALRDAWALWLAHEPICVEPLAAAHAASLSPRWRLAFAALAAETLAVMEERLAAAGPARSRPARHLAELVAGSRRLCELARIEPGGALAPTVARARAEVAWARSRLAVALPLDDPEIRRRTRPYDRRLSNAVSDALERAALIAVAPRVSVRSNEGDSEESAERSSEAPFEASAATGGNAPSDASPATTALEPPAATDGVGRISIRPTSGESWAEMRRRRAAAVARRLDRWRPIYRQTLRPLAELRAELAVELERESLDGLLTLCARLGEAARRVPPAVTAAAPAREVETAVAAVLAAYSEAGRACAAGRSTLAWSRLEAGDRHWAAMVRATERVAAEPTLPESLRRGGAYSSGSGGPGVE